jgi:hypothetical protein
MKLIIQDITENDFGQYRCYAENIEGNENAFVELQRKWSLLHFIGISTDIKLFTIDIYI